MNQPNPTLQSPALWDSTLLCVTWKHLSFCFSPVPCQGAPELASATPAPSVLSTPFTSQASRRHPFSLTGQTVYIFSFMDHTASVPTTQLYSCSMKYINKQGCVALKFYLKKKWWAGFGLRLQFADTCPGRFLLLPIPGPKPPVLYYKRIQSQ